MSGDSSEIISSPAPPGWDSSPSQGTQNEAIRNIATPPGWDTSPPKGTQQKATRNIATPPGWDTSPPKVTQYEATGNIPPSPWMGYQSIARINIMITGTQLYTFVKTDNVELNFSPKETTREKKN